MKERLSAAAHRPESAPMVVDGAPVTVALRPRLTKQFLSGVLHDAHAEMQ